MFSELAHDPEKAFSKIVEEYGPILLQQLHALCKGNDWEMELLNETFLRLWKNRHNPTVVYHENPQAWLKTVATHLYIDRYRKEKKEFKTVSWEIELEATDETQLIEQQDFFRIFEQGINQLTPMQRRIIHIHKNSDESQKEAAATLGINVQTYRNHLSQARKFMQQYLQKHYYGKG